MLAACATAGAISASSAASFAPPPLKVADALAAEPFDEAALDRAVAAYRAEVGDLVTQGTGFAVSMFRDLTPAERKLIAEKLRSRAR